jgi:hypothetical protein
VEIGSAAASQRQAAERLDEFQPGKLESSCAAGAPSASCKVEESSWRFRSWLEMPLARIF